jgi:hypothetical protein
LPISEMILPGVTEPIWSARRSYAAPFSVPMRIASTGV